MWLPKEKKPFQRCGVAWGACGRVRESFLFYIQRCYLLEIQHIFKIDFPRVGGKTFQTRKKKKRKSSLAGVHWREPQPSFGLGQRVEKGSGRPQPVRLQRCCFPPEFQHRPPTPRLLPPRGQQPPGVTSHLSAHPPTSPVRGVWR